MLWASGTARATPPDNYWLINEVTGRWEYRVGSDKPRQLTGPYDVIRPEGQVRCLEQDLRRCELRYLINPRTNATERLTVRLPEPGAWAALKGLKPPPPPVLPATSTELAKKFIRATTAGGSRAGSGCGGDLQLKAPACGETIDVTRFTVRWSALPSGSVSILLERADGEAARFRGSAPASAAEFKDANLTAFLRRIQNEANGVNVVVRVMAQGREAVRLVHIPPSSRSDDYDDRMKAVGPTSAIAAIVTRMSLALEEGMWSRAAEEASALIAVAGGNAPTLEYSLVGLCQSDFDEEKALLRRTLRAARYEEICASSASTRPGEPAASAPSAPPVPGVARSAVPDRSLPAAADPATGTPSKTRTGIALLIGNYDYWNTPLNSVKGDLKGMSETLQSLGFAVTVKENLRTPRQFVDALDEVLKKDVASPDDVLLLYYSGHGLQLDGKPQLLGTGVSPNARVAEDLRGNAQSAQDLLERMEQSIPGTRVLIIEACRNDPLIAAAGPSQPVKGGFAFQQDDVPNTFVMFANKPGVTTPVRSDYGLMGPFTESLVYALQTSPTGEILDVYADAAKKTGEISPAQEPVLYHSKDVKPLVLKRDAPVLQDTRAKDLLNSAEVSYRAHAWPEFHAAVTRAKALASDAQLQERLSHESEFAQLVMRAEAAERAANWREAASNWQKARDLFTSREWVAMRAGVAWLMADDLSEGVSALAVLSAQSDSALAQRARQMLTDLTTDFPQLKSVADDAARTRTKAAAGPEFVKIQHEE